MKLGIRASFDRLDELEHRFKGVDFPVELALPYRVGDFLSVVDRMEEIKTFIVTLQLEVLSIHATQGDLAADDYERWAKPAMELADAVKAKSVTFHPGKSRKNRLGSQARVKKHLADIQKRHRALASVETFGGRDRVLRPNEIVAAGLPMVLDTAHLRDDGYIFSLVQSYHEKISSVHLSARGKHEHHLPIDGFCLEVVSLLDDLGWNGSLILEYLPWHHYRMKEDLELLRRFLRGDHDLRPLPPDDSYRHDPSKWGFDQ
jgi:sugar phosphate isomerase/epimerase